VLEWQNGLVTAAATAVIAFLVIVSAAAMIGRTVIILVITAASLVVTAVIIGGTFTVSAVGTAVPVAYELQAGLPGKPRGRGRAEQERHADHGNG
jgi:hypothetical protein